MSEDRRILQEFKLEPDNELRFEVESKNEKVYLTLKSGLAEVFGTELVKAKTYEFVSGAKVAVFTWHGCVVEVKGKTDVIYIAKETPMVMYSNCHGALEFMRTDAEKDNKRGPIAMIVGPCDVGKSTVTRILLNYAVRMGRRPIYVDLDIGQGQISIPGTIGTIALMIERPAAIDEGAIINTCGWIKGPGYKQLISSAKSFEVDVIMVLDQERLYNELVRDMPNFVKVVFLPKSGGVVERSKSTRSEARDQRIREYFYGTPKNSLYPHSFDMKFSEFKIYKIGAPALPDSCLPLGMKADDHLTKLVMLTPNAGILHHILAVSFSEKDDDDIMLSHVVGFVCVTNIDSERQIITLLSPQPKPLPNTILILSELQFMDSH
ncbi:hypothetical protein NQ314_013052 [Rhamnusium bicolor]|uniref:Protein CLP1 homolog n=1 Tax=Rhamnusium bicolor TaxID=1586634 RepID=A0AAV8X8R1_9CUCU|nr:hypothetical protein NQ314_013052 [Rhamnusium bicolor]